ncbi:MAG: mechanosensitive ion channel family protein [Actinobacteria bacterium]|nr:mechanosensitive ion channel family protein [Actinomycetota bacterium]
MAEFWGAASAFFAQYDVLWRVVVVIVACLVANWLLRLVLGRAVRGVVRGVKKAQDVDSAQELAAGPLMNARAVQRTRTLGTFGRNIINWSTVIIGFFLILVQFGVNIAAVIASAGFIAAGLAFGAQNVVKDILNGLFMVFEDQMGVGDLVTVGTITGTVEDVGIRVTRVRASDGTLWFIRNGEILTLGNTSQGWGRAIIDITVSSSEDLELVERTALESASELLHSPQFARRVTGEPEVLGLESVSGDQATIRLAVRTRPEAQFSVQRELRALIKRHFEEQGIRLDEVPRNPGGSL